MAADGFIKRSEKRTPSESPERIAEFFSNKKLSTRKGRTARVCKFLSWALGCVFLALIWVGVLFGVAWYANPANRPHRSSSSNNTTTTITTTNNASLIVTTRHKRQFLPIIIGPGSHKLNASVSTTIPTTTETQSPLRPPPPTVVPVTHHNNTRRQLTTGSACESRKTKYHCMGTTYQRCDNNQWTVTMPMAPGQICIPGGLQNELKLDVAGPNLACKKKRRRRRQLPSPLSSLDSIQHKEVKIGSACTGKEGAWYCMGASYQVCADARWTAVMAIGGGGDLECWPTGLQREPKVRFVAYACPGDEEGDDGSGIPPPGGSGGQRPPGYHHHQGAGGGGRGGEVASPGLHGPEKALGSSLMAVGRVEGVALWVAVVAGFMFGLL